MKSKQYIILFLLFVAQFTFAQVSFVAKVSKRKLGINERLKIEFTMNKDGDNFTPPTFAGFNIVSGPSQSINRSWMNGKSTFSKTYTFTLAPTRKGNITIKNASVEIDGETYKTSPIRVQITNAVDKPKSNAEYQASENIHLVAEVSNSNPYFNEAITVTYKLYFKNINISLNDWDLPKYKDFWSQEIKLQNQRPKRGEYKDQNYEYVVLKKTVLYPQKTGKLYIDPMAAEIIANIPTDKFNFFGRVYEKANLPVSSARRVINVKPLPERGKPASFTGAVGKFDFNVVTTKSSLKAGESLEAKIEVKGTGNLKLLDLPKLSTPSSLEVYEPQRKDQISVNSAGMNGKVSDHYIIVPNFKGKYPIPSIDFSYFDLETESYKTLSSYETQIDVFDGPINNNPDENNNTSKTNKKEVVSKNKQFAFIDLSPNLKAIHKKQFFRSNLFWTLLLLPFLAIPIFLFIGKKRKERMNDVDGNRIRKADKLAKKYLSEAKNNLNSKESFYEALHKSLHNYLKAKIAIETSEFSKEKISDLLHNNNVEATVGKEFIDLLESCELARFTPISATAMKQDYDKAANCIAAIDKQIS